ncbi:MAG: ketol-acid reductoisomerase [Cyanobacteria bacterium]|nr:ketol-acid reductoisomerase [Cyanobacteriota bacterium]
MTKIYYDRDAHIEELENALIGIIGYGNQGRAHALNLRDSGLTVHVGSREEGSSRELSIKDGFEPRDFQNVAANCDVLAIFLPDEQIPTVYKSSIEPHLTSRSTFIFAHGFVVHHNLINLPSDSDILLVAPTGPGRQLRSLFVEKKGLPALIAIKQNESGRGMEKCLAYAKAIGCTRAGAIETSFAEETITDLYCEQTVLCGGIPELIKASFDTLVQAGYQPELAYISCLKEVKLIADLLFERGLTGMRDAISSTARYGSALAGPEIIDSRTKQKLEKILHKIESGDFARAFVNNPRDTDQFILDEKNSKLAQTGRFLQTNLKF